MIPTNPSLRATLRDALYNAPYDLDAQAVAAGAAVVAWLADPANGYVPSSSLAYIQSALGEPAPSTPDLSDYERGYEKACADVRAVIGEAMAPEALDAMIESMIAEGRRQERARQEQNEVAQADAILRRWWDTLSRPSPHDQEQP